MPYRKVVLASGQIYHTFNRGVASQPIFLNSREYERELQIINFYRFTKPPIRFSHYFRLPQEEKEKLMITFKEKRETIVEVLAFCLMPNHFHFLLKQQVSHGISIFMRIMQDSYGRYFNSKHKRSGAIFQSPFKAVRIETDEQLLHVSRYIHLNPVTSYLIEIDKIGKYPWSSLRYYLNPDEDGFTNPYPILSHFKNWQDYQEFILDQVDYQRRLAKIKHLTLEK